MRSPAPPVHERALHITQSKRAPAIRLYLGFGIEPVLDFPQARRARAHA
ncbi:MAG: hypothetical protein ACLFU2_09920 [Opitutales bacterium]